MISTFDDEPYSEELNALVRKARTRMLYSHVPAGSLTTGGYGLVVAWLIHVMVPTHPMTWIWPWAAGAICLGVWRTWFAFRYFRSTDRAAPHWYTFMLWHTGALSVLWASLIWMLPEGDHLDVVATVVGSMAGLAAMGAFMLTVDRLALNLWVIPLLASNILYCAMRMDIYGVFGIVSLSGFGLSLWVESARSHRRVGELLRLRFESEQLAQMQAHALNQANAHSAAKGRFLATMSHEMRTPLHGILGLSRMLRHDLNTQASHHRLDLLQGAGEHLLTVINDVLDFSRLESGHVELHSERFDLRQLVQDVTALAAVGAADKGLAVRVDLQLPERYEVLGDPGRLRQVLINLLGNAVKFTDRGEVCVRVMRQPEHPGMDQLTFEVADTGIGIAPEELDKVFDAFHQVDGAFERRAGGSGLGLSIARQVCAALGGQLSCESKVGGGSTFRFSVRLQPLNVEVVKLDKLRRAEAAHAPSRGSWTADVRHLVDRCLSGHVLLVEDNPINALVAQAELEQLGLSVTVANNGVEALHWLDSHRPDVILMDCHMPEMDGFEATRQIRQLEHKRGLKPVPVIALTANAQDDDRRMCLAVGMSDHLAKPFTPNLLLQVLKRHLPVPAEPLAVGASGMHGLLSAMGAERL
jgi:signal transduction histidine kinase/CheY-like chemotaxis protein